MKTILRNGYVCNVHELKTLPDFYIAVRDGDKRFEFRRDDGHNFAVGDFLHLRSWEPRLGYTGHELTCRVTYVLRGGVMHNGGNVGVPDGFVVMSIDDVEIVAPQTGSF